MKIYIEKEVMNKLKILSEYDVEISGWMLGKVEDSELYIDDLIIPKQEATGGSVDIDTEGVIDTLKNYKDKLKRICGHFHTHPGIPPEWSLIDEENMEKIMRKRQYFLFVVMSYMNDKYTYRARLMLNKPFKIYQECTLKVDDKDLDALRDKVDKEVKKKVSEKQYNNGWNWDTGVKQRIAGQIGVYDNRFMPPEEQGIPRTIHLKWMIQDEVDAIVKILGNTTIPYVIEPAHIEGLFNITINCPSKNKYKKIKKKLEEESIEEDRNLNDGLNMINDFEDGIGKTDGHSRSSFTYF